MRDESPKRWHQVAKLTHRKYFPYSCFFVYLVPSVGNILPCTAFCHISLLRFVEIAQRCTLKSVH